MSRIAYVNGAYVPHRDAFVSIDDRGYQFGDGVYEVVYIIDGHMADEGPHLDRLERSLSELAMPMPMSRAAFTASDAAGYSDESGAHRANLHADYKRDRPP